MCGGKKKSRGVKVHKADGRIAEFMDAANDGDLDKLIELYDESDNLN